MGQKTTMTDSELFHASKAPEERLSDEWFARYRQGHSCPWCLHVQDERIRSNEPCPSCGKSWPAQRVSYIEGPARKEWVQKELKARKLK